MKYEIRNSFWPLWTILFSAICLSWMPATVVAQTQLGNDIDGEAAGDHSGYSASLSVDGNRLAIGARHNDDNGDTSGQ